MTAEGKHNFDAAEFFVTLLRNDRKSWQQTLGCHRPFIPAVSYYFGRHQALFRKKICYVVFWGYSLNFIIKTVGINWCVILCEFRSCGPFWRQSWCSREPMDFKKYYLWKNWVVPVLLLSFFRSFWIISNFKTADIIKKCLFVESPWLPGPNLADRPSVIQTKWGF